MIPMLYEGDFIEVDGVNGVNFYDAQYFTEVDARMEYSSDKDDIYDSKTIAGWGCYLSEPGYMDRTDLTVCETKADAARHLLDTYYDMSDDEMTEAELEQAKWLRKIKYYRED